MISHNSVPRTRVRMGQLIGDPNDLVSWFRISPLSRGCLVPQRWTWNVVVYYCGWISNTVHQQVPYSTVHTCVPVPVPTNRLQMRRAYVLCPVWCCYIRECSWLSHWLLSGIIIFCAVWNSQFGQQRSRFTAEGACCCILRLCECLNTQRYYFARFETHIIWSYERFVSYI